jgi:hypothetical protein
MASTLLHADRNELAEGDEERRRSGMRTGKEKPVKVERKTQWEILQEVLLSSVAPTVLDRDRRSLRTGRRG